MLESLDKLDWHSIHHSHGTAENFPKWLRALASPDDKLRRKAFRNIVEYSNHQTSIYPVSAYIIPFLVELIETPEVKAKSHLISHIAALSGWGYNQAIDPRFRYTELPNYQPGEFELSWHESWKTAFGDYHEGLAEKAYRAAEAYLPNFLALLDHPAPKIRLEIVRLLPTFCEHGQLIVPKLCKLLPKTNEPLIKAALLVAIGQLAEPDIAYRDFLVPYLKREEKAKVRLAAAIALAKLTGENTPPEAVKLLVKLVRDPRPYYHIFRAFYEVYQAPHALCYLAPRWSKRLIPVVTAKFKECDEWSKFDWLEVLMHLAFTSYEPGTKLSRQQKQVLKLAATNKYLWDYNCGERTRRLLNHFAMPTNQAALLTLSNA